MSYSDSAERKGLYGASLSGLTWVPLASLTETPKKALEIIDSLRKRIEEKAQAGLLPPGLKEQYDHQLEELETRGYGDCEILFYPRYFGIGGTLAANTLRINVKSISHIFFLSLVVPEPGKFYLSTGTLLNHPFSRGTIVSV